jgi:hypothetical protein
MKFSRKIRACLSSFFAMVLAIILLASGGAYAQCNFFTGFADNKDGTVTDTRNGLIWKRCAEGSDFNNGVCIGNGKKASWESAKSMAKQSRFLDKSDWRLPTKKEFMAVLGDFNECKLNQAGEYAASKAIAIKPDIFWSSSPYDGLFGGIWYVNFLNGGFYHDADFDSNDDVYVRLVRKGKVKGGEASLEFVNQIAETNIKRGIGAPMLMLNMPEEKLCAAYGSALREGVVYGIGPFPDIVRLVRNESARRKLEFDDKLISSGKIKLGISECQLYASWGLPKDQNRTVGSWGVHIQHIYGSGSYVYTQNGRVTSWQD